MLMLLAMSGRRSVRVKCTRTKVGEQPSARNLHLYFIYFIFYLFIFYLSIPARVEKTTNTEEVGGEIQMKTGGFFGLLGFLWKGG